MDKHVQPGVGRDQGLLMAIDLSNTEKSLLPVEVKSIKTTMRSIPGGGKMIRIDSSSSSQKESQYKMYINTLLPFITYGGGSGSYAMTSLKKMTGTTLFLEMDQDSRGCQIEVYEDCWIRNFQSMGQEICGCTPFEISKPLDYEVR